MFRKTNILLISITLFNINNLFAQSAEDYFNRGVEALDTENWFSAREYFDRAIELNPNFTSALYERAMWLITYSKDEANLILAINDLNKVLKLDTTFCEAYYHRALSKLKMNKDDESAIKDLVSYNKYNDIYFKNSMYDIINARWVQKKYSSLINELEYLYTYHRNNIKYKEGILYADYLFKEYTHALSTVNELLQYNMRVELLIARSNIYAKLGQLRASLSDIDSALILIQTDENKIEKIKNLMLIKVMNLNELHLYEDAIKTIYNNLNGSTIPDNDTYKFFCELAISKYGLKDYTEALSVVNVMIDFFEEQRMDGEYMMKMFIYRALLKKGIKGNSYSDTEVCEDFNTAIKLSEEYLLPRDNYPELENICK